MDHLLSKDFLGKPGLSPAVVSGQWSVVSEDRKRSRRHRSLPPALPSREGHVGTIPTPRDCRTPAPPEGSQDAIVLVRLQPAPIEADRVSLASPLPTASRSVRMAGDLTYPTNAIDRSPPGRGAGPCSHGLAPWPAQGTIVGESPLHRGPDPSVGALSSIRWLVTHESFTCV